MELKRLLRLQFQVLCTGSNRTFMELKRIRDNIINSSLIVLIVPLWN